MTDQSFTVGVLAFVVLALVFCVCYCVRILARERDHLLARNIGEVARAEKARQPATAPRAELDPRDIREIWSHDSYAAQLEAMGDGDRIREREPMVEGMNGL